jgi:hypothetical protein
MPIAPSAYGSQLERETVRETGWMTERLIEPGMLLRPELELRERLDEPRLDDERPRPLVDDERRLVLEDPFDDEFAIVLVPG